MQEAGRCIGIPNPINISAVCRNKIKSCGGYSWMYEKDFFDYIKNLEFIDMAQSLQSEFNKFNNNLYRTN